MANHDAVFHGEMNTTQALPKKLDRAICQRCRIESPIAIMRSEGTFNVCTNDAACRKRSSRLKIENAPPTKRETPREPAPAKRTRKRKSTEP